MKQSDIDKFEDFISDGNIMHKKVIDKIRQFYKLPTEITDEQIAKKLRGSLGEAVANFDLAIKKLTKAFSESIPSIFKKYLKRKGEKP